MNNTLIIIIIVILILILLFVCLFNYTSKHNSKGGVLTVYQTDDNIKSQIDLYTDIYLGHIDIEHCFNNEFSIIDYYTFKYVFDYITTFSDLNDSCKYIFDNIKDIDSTANYFDLYEIYIISKCYNTDDRTKKCIDTNILNGYELDVTDISMGVDDYVKYANKDKLNNILNMIDIDDIANLYKLVNSKLEIVKSQNNDMCKDVYKNKFDKNNYTFIKQKYNITLKYVENILNIINTYDENFASYNDPDYYNILAGIAISAIEIYLVCESKNINMCEIEKFVGSGAYNIALLTKSGNILRIGKYPYYENKFEVENFISLELLNRMYKHENVKKYLPNLILSSLNIKPEFKEFNKESYVSNWYFEPVYKELKLEDVDINKYTDLIINICIYAKKCGAMYSDWKLDNIMVDNEGNYILTDIDFIQLNMTMVTAYADVYILESAVNKILGENIIRTNFIVSGLLGLYNVYMIHFIKTNPQFKNLSIVDDVYWPFLINACMSTFGKNICGAIIGCSQIDINDFNNIIMEIKNSSGRQHNPTMPKTQNIINIKRIPIQRPVSEHLLNPRPPRNQLLRTQLPPRGQKIN